MTNCEVIAKRSETRNQIDFTLSGQRGIVMNCEVITKRWETRNQIDFTLSSRRGIVTNCELIIKVDIGSDHCLVSVTLRINKRLATLLMKNNKATGTDNLTSDITILGGEESVKHITTICNKILEIKKRYQLNGKKSK